MDRRRLILYLLLNVFVSACVTGGILFWYDRNYRSTSLSSVQPALPPVSQSGAPAASFDPNVDLPVKIVSIVGAGTLDAEWVVVRNAGSEPINLASWQLRDADRNVFVFPNLTLNPNGAVQVHTISGTNTVIDLYWGLNNPVWESGEEAQLLDPNGNVRAVYQVP
ncbi:MAG: hypothetical protein Kow0070_14060 [Anaerolineales bacterium]